MKTPLVNLTLALFAMVALWSCKGDRHMAPYPDEPAVQLSDEVIDFGRQVYGEAVQQTFVIRHQGAPGHQLYLYYFVEDEVNFSATHSDEFIVLQPSDAWQIRLQFTARRTGHLRSRLILFMSHYPLDEDRAVTRREVLLEGEARQLCPYPELPEQALAAPDQERVRQRLIDASRVH